MPLSAGTRLGHDDVTALLGEGGMGQVWQATDTQLNRAELAATLDDIATDALRAGAIIQRLRSLVRRLPAEYRPVDLNALADEAMSLVADDLRLKEINVRVDLAADLPRSSVTRCSSNRCC